MSRHQRSLSFDTFGGLRPKTESHPGEHAVNTVLHSTPTKMVWSVLPQELTDVIINDLRDDKLSLSACSSVSRSWHDTARSRLFHVVSVCGLDTERGFHAFHRFLKESHPLHPFRFIRVLHLYGTQPDDFNFPRPPLTTSLLRSILSHLPELLDLGLNELSWEHDEDREDGITAPKPLRTLALDSVEFIGKAERNETPTHAIDNLIPERSCAALFSLFSTVGELRTRHVWLEGYESYEEVKNIDIQHGIKIATDFRVNNVKVNTYTTLFLLEFLRHSGVGSLQSLSIVSDDQWVTLAAQAILGDASTNLLHLKYDFDGWEMLSEDPDAVPTIKLDLSRCSSLHTAEFRCYLNFTDVEGSQELFNIMLDTVVTIPPCIRKVVIELFVSLFSLARPEDAYGMPVNLQMIQSLAWHRLNNMLSRHENLLNVTITIQVPMDRQAQNLKETEAASIEAALPTLRGDGVLHCLEIPIKPRSNY